MTVKDMAETTTACHIFHDNPVVAPVIDLDVIEGDEVLVLEVDALLHASQLDLGVPSDELEHQTSLPASETA